MEGEDAESYWETCLGISGRLQMLLRGIPQEAAEKIESRAKEGAGRLREGDSLIIPGEEGAGRAKA
jgi:hypothetical protein